jgi:hypothetical protein
MHRGHIPLFCHEAGGDKFLRNVGSLSTGHIASRLLCCVVQMLQCPDLSLSSACVFSSVSAFPSVTPGAQVLAYEASEQLIQHM